jgi:hypothetical protein
VDLFRETGDHYGQAHTLTNLGIIHAQLDDPRQAWRAWSDAAELYIAAGAEDAADRVRQRIAALDP